MTQLRLDKVLLTNLVDTYLNYGTLTSPIVISGSVADGATATFSTSIPYTRTKTKADLYAKNLTTGVKRPISGGYRQSPYTFTSTETASVAANYVGGVITVTFSIFNGTGGPITLVTQTMEISAVLYEVPF